eukprot:4657105-Prymnesium_polylepis.1
MVQADCQEEGLLSARPPRTREEADGPLRYASIREWDVRLVPRGARVRGATFGQHGCQIGTAVICALAKLLVW